VCWVRKGRGEWVGQHRPSLVKVHAVLGQIRGSLWLGPTPESRRQSTSAIGRLGSAEHSVQRRAGAAAEPCARSSAATHRWTASLLLHKSARLELKSAPGNRPSQVLTTRKPWPPWTRAP
jgi:hypothetical protein